MLEEFEDATHRQIIHKLDKESALLKAEIRQTSLDVANLRIDRKEDITSIRTTLDKIETKIDRHALAVNDAMVESARLSGAQKIITALIGAGAGGAVTVIASILKRGVT